MTRVTQTVGYEPYNKSKGILRRRILRLRRYGYPYLFLSPFYIMFLIFTLYPIVGSFLYSFFRFQSYTSYKFTWFTNYKDIFLDKRFLVALGNTAYFSVVTVLIQISLPIVVAVFLNIKWVRFNNFFRASYFLPILISTIVASIIFSYFYDLKYGIINYALEKMFLPRIDWLGNPYFSMPALILMNGWRISGINTLIFLGALKNIPETLYDAGAIDGANKSQLFRYITIPMLRPVMLFVCVLTFTGSFQLFAEPFMMTRGGPGISTYTIVMYIYDQGFRYSQLGMATAAAYIMFIIIFGVSIGMLKSLGFFEKV
ncbi:MAG: sugar ABC transporter permease [Actinobacteria bacterium]|nr:sugar ABC transporter permease [Actinomycetota bacterium]